MVSRETYSDDQTIKLIKPIHDLMLSTTVKSVMDRILPWFRAFIDRHFTGIFLLALVGVILLAPHHGNVGGWLFKWIMAGLLLGGATVLMLVTIAILIAWLR